MFCNLALKRAISARASSQVADLKANLMKSNEFRVRLVAGKRSSPDPAMCHLLRPAPTRGRADLPFGQPWPVILGSMVWWESAAAPNQAIGLCSLTNVKAVARCKIARHSRARRLTCGSAGRGASGAAAADAGSRPRIRACRQRLVLAICPRRAQPCG